MVGVGELAGQVAAHLSHIKEGGNYTVHAWPTPKLIPFNCMVLNSISVFTPKSTNHGSL